MPRVYLGVGSNLGDRLSCLREAVGRLRTLAGVAVVGVSRLYDTEPWGIPPGPSAEAQPRYLNCVVAVETDLAPRRLLTELQGIEAGLGRARSPGRPEAFGFAPRTLDIDILLYGDTVVSMPDDLQIPHLLLADRAFVLRPLADLAPNLEHPTLYRTIRELLEDLGDAQDVQQTGDPATWAEGLK